MRTEVAMSAALDAILEEALRLLDNDISEEVRWGLEVIASLARYKHPIRTPDGEEEEAID